MTGLIRRRPVLVAFAVLLLATLGAFSAIPAAQLALVNAPARWFGGRVLSDLQYDSATGQRLDLYLPAEAQGTKDLPVILFFYGGSWQGGDKEDYRFVGTTLAQRGYLVAIPDYRKFPAVRFPAFVEDGAAAVAWVMGQIADHGGDPNRVFLSGHSAGAHIAALLVSDERYLAAQGVTPDQIRAFAGLAGPYHFTPKAPNLVEIFGPPDRYPLMQAGRFIDGGEPPMLLLYGLADRTVAPANLQQMESALIARGNCHQVIRYPGIDHIAIVSAFTWIHRARRPMLDDMLEFFDRVVTGAACPA